MRTNVIKKMVTNVQKVLFSRSFTVAQCITLLLLVSSPALAQSSFPGQLPVNCTNGQVPVYSTSQNVWNCGSGGGGGTIGGSITAGVIAVGNGVNTITGAYNGEVESTAKRWYFTSVFDDTVGGFALTSDVQMTGTLDDISTAFRSIVSWDGNTDPNFQFITEYIAEGANISGGAASNVAGMYFYPPEIGAGGSIGAYFSTWKADICDSGADYLAFDWDDARDGVRRTKADSTFDAVCQAIEVLYNPLFPTKYTPDEPNFERLTTGQWNGNVAEYGTERGGTGVLRDSRIIGRNFLMRLGSAGEFTAQYNGQFGFFSFTDGDLTAGMGIAGSPTMLVNTKLDATTVSPNFNLNVHGDEANAADFFLRLDGNSGNNTPATTFVFPGAAIFSAATSYSFNAAVYSSAATSIASTSANSCGTTSPTFVGTGTNTGGKFTVGATSGTDCTLTFSVAATQGWSCGVSNTSTANLVRATPVSTTTTKFQGVFVAGDVIQYACNPY